MKKYIAIGHWNESENITSVAESTYTMKHFKDDLKGNGFTAYIVLTEKRFEKLHNMIGFEVLEEIKGSMSNYRHILTVVDYIEQCYDIMEERIENVEM